MEAEERRPGLRPPANYSEALQQLITSAEAERELLQPVLEALDAQSDAVLALVQSHKALASSLRALEQGSQDHMKKIDGTSPTVLSPSSSLRTASLLSATCDPLRGAATTASATKSSLQALSEALSSGVRQMERRIKATAALARQEEESGSATLEEIRQFQRQHAEDFDTALFCLEEGTRDALRMAALALGLSGMTENGEDGYDQSYFRQSVSSPNSVSSTAATPNFSDGTDYVTSSPQRTSSSAGRRSAGRETPRKIPKHEGWLLKRSSNVRADWKRRRFLLYADGQIDYHRPLSKSHSIRGSDSGISSTIGGSMHLSITTVKDIPSVSGPSHRFSLVSPNKTIQLAAPTEEEKKEWIDMIKMVSASLFETTIPNQSEAALNSHAASAALVALREAPGNRLCADCSVANPEWGCLTFGVLVCLECSGGHRRLGTDISKIRSTTLDVRVWTSSTLALFADLGNEFVNSIMEAKFRNAEEIERADSCEFHTPPSSPRAQQQALSSSLDKDTGPDSDIELDSKSSLGLKQRLKLKSRGHLRHKSEDLRTLTKGLTLDDEECENKTLKPSAGATVKEKEHFVQLKYATKGFATFPSQELLCSEKTRYNQAIGAAKANDVRELLRLMVWFKEEMVSKWSHELIMAAATGSTADEDEEDDAAAAADTAADASAEEGEEGDKGKNIAALELLTNNDIGLREPTAMASALIASLKIYRDEAAKLLVRKCPSVLRGRDEQGRTPMDIVMERGRCSHQLLELLSPR